MRKQITFEQLKKHPGIFKIPSETIEKYPGDIFAIMANIIPVYVEKDLMTGVVRYSAYSMLFRKVKVGEIAPYYTFEITVNDKEEIVSVKALEVEE